MLLALICITLANVRIAKTSLKSKTNSLYTTMLWIGGVRIMGTANDQTPAVDSDTMRNPTNDDERSGVIISLPAENLRTIPNVIKYLKHIKNDIYVVLHRLLTSDWSISPDRKGSYFSATIASEEDGKSVEIKFWVKRENDILIKNILNEARNVIRAKVETAKQSFIKSATNYIGDLQAKANAEKAAKDRENAIKEINTSISTMTATSVDQQAKVEVANGEVAKMTIALENSKQARDKENLILSTELAQITTLQESLTKLPAKGASLEGFQANIDKDLVELNAKASDILALVPSQTASINNAKIAAKAGDNSKMIDAVSKILS